jgi:hypothetical protein
MDDSRADKSGPLICDRTAADCWWRRSRRRLAARGGVGWHSSLATLELELPASDFDGNNSKMKHGTSRTYLGTWDGGRRDGEGDQGGGTPVAAELRSRPVCARGDGGEVVREEARLEGALYRVERGAEGTCNAVARVQWPAAIDGGGGSSVAAWCRRFREGR